MLFLQIVLNSLGKERKRANRGGTQPTQILSPTNTNFCVKSQNSSTNVSFNEAIDGAIYTAPRFVASNICLPTKTKSPTSCSPKPNFYSGISNTPVIEPQIGIPFSSHFETQFTTNYQLIAKCGTACTCIIRDVCSCTSIDISIYTCSCPSMHSTCHSEPSTPKCHIGTKGIGRQRCSNVNSCQSRTIYLVSGAPIITTNLAYFRRKLNVAFPMDAQPHALGTVSRHPLYSWTRAAYDRVFAQAPDINDVIDVVASKTMRINSINWGICISLI